MKRINRGLVLCLTGMLLSVAMHAQTAEEIIGKVRTKLDKVNDYEAKAKMKTNVAFIKAPIATVKIYFKKPNKVRINNEKGISFIPKGSMNINLANLFPTGATAFDLIDLGKDSATKWRLIKLVPRDMNSDIQISTLYIDEANSVIRKAQTTTRTNGSYELQMTYGKYVEYGLADKIIFSFNTENFKLPKGVTMDYDDGARKEETEAEKERKKKGKVEITYSSYTINQGVPDTVFQ